MPAPIELLPAELLYQILQLLDIPDLFTLTRASRTLRSHASSPILHRQRLKHTRSYALPKLLSSRPTIIQLRGKQIYKLPQDTARLKVARDLTCVALKHRLGRRPPVEVLVENGVMPVGILTERVPELDIRDDKCSENSESSGGANRNRQELDILMRPGMMDRAQMDMVSGMLNNFLTQGNRRET